MPARKTDAAAQVTAAVGDLLRSVTALVDGVGAAVRHSPEVKNAARGVGSAAKDVSAAAKAKSEKLRKALKAYWSKMKGQAREARINVMLKGRGVKRRKTAKG